MISKKQISILILLLLSPLCMLAQSMGTYYLSYEDFLQDTGVNIQVEMKHLSLKKSNKKVSGEFKPSSKDVSAKILKKNALFIKVGDKLFINHYRLNCQRISMGKNYSLCFREGKGNVVFTSVIGGQQLTKAIDEDIAKQEDIASLNEKEDENPNLFLEIIGDILNHIIKHKTASKRVAKMKCVYLLRPSDHLEAVAINKNTMHYLLGYRPDLIDEYDQIEGVRQLAPEVIFSYLNRANLLK